MNNPDTKPIPPKVGEFLELLRKENLMQIMFSGLAQHPEMQELAARLRAQSIGELVMGGFFQLVEVDRGVNAEPLPAGPCFEEGVPDSVIAEILAVGRERKQWLDQLRTFLVRGQDREALQVARRVCNIPEEGADNARRPKAVR